MFNFLCGRGNALKWKWLFGGSVKGEQWAARRVRCWKTARKFDLKFPFVGKTLFDRPAGGEESEVWMETSSVDQKNGRSKDYRSFACPHGIGICPAQVPRGRISRIESDQIYFTWFFGCFTCGSFLKQISILITRRISTNWFLKKAHYVHLVDERREDVKRLNRFWGDM